MSEIRYSSQIPVFTTFSPSLVSDYLKFSFHSLSSHAVTSDLDTADVAKAAEFFLSDGVILTGQSTGLPADEEILKQVKKTTALPILIGSGVTVDNLSQYVNADALIVGSHFKEGGMWSNAVHRERVMGFMSRVQTLRQGMQQR